MRPVDCPNFLVEKSVYEMYGTASKEDTELFKEAYASTNGDLKMARIMFNKMKTARNDGERSALRNVVKFLMTPPSRISKVDDSCG